MPVLGWVGFGAAMLFLAYVIYAVIRNYLIPRFSALFRGFRLSPKLRELDRSKFLFVKKLRLDKKCIDCVIVSNYGVFVIKMKDIRGVIEKASGREGSVVRYKGSTRFYRDDEKESLKDIERIKELSPLMREVKFHPMLVFPDQTEVRLESADFCGNIKDMLAFVESRCTEENAVSNTVKTEIFEILQKKKENIKVQ